MKAVIDAHAFIWWVLDMPDLSEACREVLADGTNEVFPSATSSDDVESIW